MAPVQMYHGVPVDVLLAGPALEAPPGADTRMTLDSPEQVWYLVTAILCIALPGLFLIARVYTKLAVVKTFDAADYLIFVAYPLMVTEVALGYLMVKYGAGVHQWQVTLGQLYGQLQYMNIAEIVYCPAIFAVKMAILVQYLKMFAPNRTVNPTMYIGAWFVIGACFIFYTIVMFWTIFYCSPRPMIWNKFTPGGKCHDHSPIVVSSGIFNMVSDVVILLLPTSSLWKLRVPVGKKIAVTMLFGTGLLACGASVMRIVFTIKIAPKLSEADVSQNGLWIGLWSEAEIALGFIVACALTLPKLIKAKSGQISAAFTYLSMPLSLISSFRGSEKSTTAKSSSSASENSSSKKDSKAPRKEQKYMLQSLHFESFPDSAAMEKERGTAVG